ncbi:MAG: MOSC domain-containing protein YiiM [Pirellulaceae bacterium]|jgi:MOSC domain-containing protein YiiM
MADGNVEQLFIAAGKGEEMQSVQAAKTVVGKGLEGDRYFDGTGTFSPDEPKPDSEITFIEAENIENFAADHKLSFSGADARRNVVTRGIALNDLVDTEFQVGEARIRAIRLCEPCQYLAERTHAEILPALVGRGGLRAQIIGGGTIRVGDEIRID